MWCGEVRGFQAVGGFAGPTGSLWGNGGLAVTHQSAFGLDQGPVLAVHLVVEAAGVAEVVARPVPPPQRRGGGSAVHTLAALCAEFRGGKHKQKFI